MKKERGNHDCAVPVATESSRTGGPGDDSGLCLPFCNGLSPLVLFAGIKQSLADLGTWLIAYGALGLFGIALLDSALVPLPAGPDLVMITLSATRPALMPLYALAATLGSAIGCTFLYLLARRAGSSALARVSPARRGRIENLLGRYDMYAVIVPAVLPPPFPFKAFVLSAGVFRLKVPRFITAILIGRAARFLIEGWLAVEFGEDAFALIKRHSVKVLIGVVGIFVVWLAAALYRRRARALTQDEVQPPL